MSNGRSDIQGRHEAFAPNRLAGGTGRFDFQDGFALDEEKLRQIASIIRENAPEEVTHVLRFRVDRADDYAYVTRNIEDIVGEKNYESEQIIEIAVEAFSETFNLDLRFANGTVRFRLDGADRDKVQVLNTRLRSFVHNDVCMKPLVSKKARSAGVLLGTALLGAGSILYGEYFYMPSWQRAQDAIASVSEIEKLNFLIEHRQGQSRIVEILLATILVLLVFIAVFSDRLSLLRRLFPRTVFLFGHGVDRYNKAKLWQERLGWGGLGALIISIVAGFIVWWVTKPT